MNTEERKEETGPEEEGSEVQPTDSDVPKENPDSPSEESKDVLEDLGLEADSEKPKKEKKTAAAKAEDVSDSPFAGLDKPSKFPLILYIFSLVLVGLGVFLGINNGKLDAQLSTALISWGNDPANAGLLNILTALPKIIGGLLAPLVVIVIGLVFVIIRNPKVMKYGGMIVVLSLLGVGVNYLLMGIFGRATPTINSTANSWFIPQALFGGWTTGSFPSLSTALAGVLFAFPYCFNGKKGLPLKIVTAIIATLFVVFMGIALVVTSQNWLSDVLFAGIIQFWFAAIVGRRVLSIRDQELFDVYCRVNLPLEQAYKKILKSKSVLEESEVDFLLNKAKQVLLEEQEEIKKLKEKAKPVEHEQYVIAILELIEKSLNKIKTEKIEVQENVKQIFEKFAPIEALAKPPKKLIAIKSLFEEVQKIAEDNKTFALTLLDQSIELYNKAIEAAEKEPGDFSSVIKKAKVWIGYVNRFKEGLTKLPRTSGTDFETYMKQNYMYII